MKDLRLDDLNIKASYSVWKSGNGSYSFKTEYGVLCKVVFSDCQVLWQEGAYELSVINENRKPSPNDKRVKETIFAIIEEFFFCNPDILLYQCETGDNKQGARDRLFLKWFNEYEFSKDYYIKVSQVVAEGISNYAAMIVQRSNPNLQSIIDDFDDFVGFLSDKPQ